MVNLFEHMAVNSRNVARGRVERLYKVTVSIGHHRETVDAWAVNACEAMRKALDGKSIDSPDAQVSARLVG